MTTFSAREADVQRRWLVVDAEGKTLGRLAAQVASVLKGKHKPIYTPHVDTGDHVIVINAAKVRLTGTKPVKKTYFHHTMYPGGATWTRLTEMLARHPERVVQKAVRGMMPKNRLGDAMFRKLKVYAGAEHPHEAQRPETWQLEA
ncbi:MAG TPA: 50S ribosomal protein L13 [Candidatus Acidoferrales bacterium]|nr:50S ribosomal protein L13 [Candidatus Acidoferrales bacterium]